MWFLDCYSHKAIIDLDFPVNTYYGEDLVALIEAAKKVLMKENSGIDKIRISRETKGQCPIRINRSSNE